MFKTFEPPVFVFDSEWVPDVDAGRRLYSLPGDVPDEDVIAHMYVHDRQYDAENKPRPYLPTPLCRIVSMSVVIRQADGSISLLSIPQIGALSVESEIVGRFLYGVVSKKAQIVGWNSSSADWWIFVQRAMHHDMTFPGLKRASKPWEGADYFDRYSTAHVDLKGCCAAFGANSPSLDVMAACLGIPGKMDVDGSDVVDLWLAGKVDEIVAYNECDAITTYLVWLRLAHFGGFLTPAEFEAGTNDVHQLLRKDDKPHLLKYLERWASYE